jgi:hypothetical protein
MERATGARARMAVNGMHFPSAAARFTRGRCIVFQVSMKIIEKEGRCIVPARSAKWNTVHTVRSEFFLMGILVTLLRSRKITDQQVEFATS